MKQQELALDSISLQGAAREIRKNWWVVVCLALAVMFGSLGVGKLFYTPQYTATATLVIRAKGSDAYTSLAQTTQMAAVYSEVFQSDALRSMISESIGEPVEGQISCRQIEETNLLVLSGISPTPRQAYLFIHSALQNYEQVAGYVFSNAALEIVQEPTVPEEPSNVSFLAAHCPELTLMAVLGAAVLIVLIYFLRNTVKVASKAGNLLDGKSLGVIPHERKQTKGGKRVRGKAKKGVPALLLTSPLVSMTFSEATRRVATRLEAHMQRKQYKTVLVVSVEENEGKSTVAANLAIALAEHGKQVALIDGDFRKPAQWRIFDEQNVKRPSFSDLVAGKAGWEETARLNPRGGFWELFQFKTLKNPVALLNSQNLPALLEALRTQMDYLVIDCSPVAAAADAEIWMHHADTAVLVVRQDISDVRVINDTIDMIWKSAGDFSGFILNAFQRDNLPGEPTSRYGSY